MAEHVRIDRAMQGTEGHETPADRLLIDSTDFLWLFVEAILPSGAAPHGEYFREVNGVPDKATRIALEPVSHKGDMYRFYLIHYMLSPQTRYLFQFADDLASPTYQDSWEIQTV